jgi:hypothetical protein
MEVVPHERIARVHRLERQFFEGNSLASEPAPGQMSMIQSEHQHAKGLKQQFQL